MVPFHAAPRGRRPMIAGRPNAPKVWQVHFEAQPKAQMHVERLRCMTKAEMHVQVMFKAQMYFHGSDAYQLEVQMELVWKLVLYVSELVSRVRISSLGAGLSG